LAYAGLPLTADEIQAPEVTKPKIEKRTVSATNDPDVKKIFSKAALHAIEEQHRQSGSHGQAFGPAESFYVVQKGGGTYSYADIAKAQQQHLAGIDEEDDDSFVDAREGPGPPSPLHSRSASHRSRTSFGKPRTQEELELENATLKQTLEHVAGRLNQFELHAQDASIMSLQHSMIGMRPPSEGVVDPGLAERLGQLERQVEQQAEERQRADAMLARQREQLKKYHSKWEEIKAGAKEKQRAKREKAEKASEDDAIDSPAL